MTSVIEPVDLGSECEKCSHPLSEHGLFGEPADGPEFKQLNVLKCLVNDCECRTTWSPPSG